jgi:membrane protein implicated in regulation of membrane protease activity
MVLILMGIFLLVLGLIILATANLLLGLVVLAAGLALALAALPFVAWGPLGPYNDREDVVRRRRPYAGYPRRVRRTTTIEEDDVSGPPAGPA